MSTRIVTQRQKFLDTTTLWDRFCGWVTSTKKPPLYRLVWSFDDPHSGGGQYLFCGWPLSPPRRFDIDGIREPVIGSILGGNNLITAAVIPTSCGHWSTFLSHLGSHVSGGMVL